ncbi:MAG: membrane protein insertase YidC, partial [Gemmatimonadetes bacterium]|nr:membrane protein insertase YidC [Gemmatimonadota bacterium]
MDRRFLAAIGLMMLVVLAPTILFKRPPRPLPAAEAPSSIGAPDSAAAPITHAPGVRSPAPTAVPPLPAAAAVAEDTVVVRSGLYQYSLSTRGARVIGAQLLRYRSMAVGDKDGPAELVRAGDGLFALSLVTGSDTLSLADWQFTPSATEVRVSGETPVTFTASRGNYTVELTYTFSPDDYRMAVRGRVTGLGPTGGLLIVGLGEGIRNTEADSSLNARDFALVVRPVAKDPQAITFRKPSVGETRVEPGPFTWAAVKSKYFVLGVFARDSAARWAAAEMRREDPAKLPHYAALRLSLPVAADGSFGWRTYAGPMEYP